MWWQLLLLWYYILILGGSPCEAQCDPSKNPLSINGGCAAAMIGHNCVAVAVDRRLGSNEQLVSDTSEKVLKLSSRVVCAFTGLLGDSQTLMSDLTRAVRLKSMREGGKPVSPRQLSGMLSAMLYAARSSPFFCEPIVAGLEPDGKPFICVQDVLGARSFPKDFAVAGFTAARSLYGACEAFYCEGMDEETLFQTMSSCLLAAAERDCLSGYGAIVHIISKEGILSREVEGRRD
eukprot:243191_1